jgi:hypothetical protein
VVVADVALCFARRKGGKGFNIHGVVVRSLAFADDMSGHDNKKGDLELTLQALLLTLGAIFGVRFNATKSFYLHSRNADGGSLELCMLDSNGRWSKQEVLAAKPDKEAWGHDGQGSSGGGRYLGPWFGYVTCPGADRWIVHRIALKRLTDGFTGRVRAQRPTVPQLYEAVQGVLLGAHMYSWQVVTPTEEELTALRTSIASMVIDCLGVRAPTGAVAVEVIEEIMCPVRWGGLGAPDPLRVCVSAVAGDAMRLLYGRTAETRTMASVRDRWPRALGCSPRKWGYWPGRQARYCTERPRARRRRSP